MPDAPLFSVVIPVYNVAPYVRATVESVLGQSVSDLEVIAVNDGSTDGSLSELRKIDDPRIRVVDKANTGVSDTRNVGCRQARGRYIAFLDADDYWYPDHLSEALAFFGTHPDVPWCGAAQFLVPVDLPPPVRTSPRRFRVRRFFEDGKWAVHSSNMVIRRDLFDLSGGYPTGMRQFEDHVFQSRIGARFPLVGFNERVTSVYYTRPGSASSRKPADLSDTYEALVRTLAAALSERPEETPLYPRQMLRALLKAALFYRSEREVESLLDEFGPILPPGGVLRWRRFVRCAYRLARGADMDEALRTLVATSLKGRVRETFRLLRTRGVRAAVTWGSIVALYSLRGWMDTLDDRRDRRAIAKKSAIRPFRP